MPIDCTDPTISLNVLLNALRVRTGGVEGLRVRIITAAAADIEGVVACGGANVSDTEVMRLSMGLSASGETALILIQES